MRQWGLPTFLSIVSFLYHLTTEVTKHILAIPLQLKNYRPGFGKSQNRMVDICKAGLLPIMFVVSAS
jgi:hypothetical protein